MNKLCYEKPVWGKGYKDFDTFEVLEKEEQIDQTDEESSK